MESVKQCII
jgi:hypothetical protein